MWDAGLCKTFSTFNPWEREEIKSDESKHISINQNKWSTIFSLQFSLELHCSYSLTTLSLSNLWWTLDFLKKGGEMTSRAEGWKRVFLIVLHTMWRWGLTWTFLPFSKMKWMYLVKIQPLRWGSQSRWLCQSSYFLKSHRESPLREKLSLSLMLLFSETQNFSPSHRSSHL